MFCDFYSLFYFCFFFRSNIYIYATILSYSPLSCSVNCVILQPSMVWAENMNSYVAGELGGLWHSHPGSECDLKSGIPDLDQISYLRVGSQILLWDLRSGDQREISDVRFQISHLGSPNTISDLKSQSEIWDSVMGSLETLSRQPNCLCLGLGTYCLAPITAEISYIRRASSVNWSGWKAQPRCSGFEKKHIWKALKLIMLASLYMKRS